MRKYSALDSLVMIMFVSFSCCVLNSSFNCLSHQQKGDECAAKENVELTEGWQWIGEWEIDTNRAVDDQGMLLSWLVGPEGLEHNS